MIDLHMHSTFSDGSLAPQELAEVGKQVGLSGMALTDHDTTAGVAAFIEATASVGVIGVTGVEISAEVSHGTLHMLGYHIDPGSATLGDALAQIRGGREYRNRKILARLQELGMTIEWDYVAGFAGDEVVGRPHFAQALLAKGYVESKQEAFDRLLGKGQQAYVDRFRLSPADSIQMIRGAGGVPVLSHPYTLDLNRVELREFIKELAAQGLQGMEVYYSEHSKQQTAEYKALADDLGLVATGGSDFHGDVNPDVRMGVGFGPLRVPDSVLAAIESRIPLQIAASESSN